MSRSITNNPPEQTFQKRSISLTATTLRRYTGLENLSNEQAVQAVDAIEKLSNLLFYVLKNGEIIDHED